MTQVDVTTGLIALGSNLSSGGISPDRAVARAMDKLAEVCGGDVARSRLFSSPAFPAGSGPDFVNAAMRVDWRGSADELLQVLHGMEAIFGRTRNRRWEARVMDLDLIAFGDAVLPDAETRARWAALSSEEAGQLTPEKLIVPHPRLAERAFVLLPLADVAPDWVDPATGMSLRAMLRALEPEVVESVRPLQRGATANPGCQ